MQESKVNVNKTKNKRCGKNVRLHTNWALNNICTCSTDAAPANWGTQLQVLKGSILKHFEQFFKTELG